MIEEIKGTKSTKIMELINRKLQGEKEKMLKAHIKDKLLNKACEQYKRSKEEVERCKKVLEKRKDELDLQWNGYGNEACYQIKDKCRISKDDFESLQKAQDLYSIGKKEKAKLIWEDIIKKHKLFRG